MRSLPVAMILAVAAEAVAAPPDRVEASLEAAAQARGAGDLPAAQGAIDVAWIYLSPVFETAWRRRGAERTRLTDALAREEQALVVARARPGLLAEVEGIERRLEAELAAKRPSPANLAKIAEEAQACQARASGLAQDDLVESCQVTAQRAATARAAAEEAARARDAELRAVLSGERLELYEKYGEPVGEFASDDPTVMARARTWVFVIGPTGALKSYEKLVVTFNGNRVVARKRTTFKEQLSP